MARTVIRLFHELSAAHQALEALAAQGFPRDGLSLLTRQERVPPPEAEAGWGPRLVAVPGVGPVLAIGPIAAALSGRAGEVEGEGLLRVLMERGAPPHEAQACVEAVSHGEVLVLVDTDEGDPAQAEEILRRVGAGDQQTLTASWTSPVDREG